MFRTNRLMRYINQNKKIIFYTIAAIGGLIIVIQLLNSFAGKKLNSGSDINTTKLVPQSIYKPNETILTNTTINETQAEQNAEIINEFIEYGKNGEFERAYELLTDECKEVLYPTIDQFKNNYCEKVFDKNSTYNIQSWMNKGNNYTYKVRFLEDILATGKYNSEALEDYITIVYNNNQAKINVNSYIARQEMNIGDKDNKNIEIDVIYKDVYREYEEYAMKITNNTDKDILMDDLETVDGIKLINDSNDVEYQAITNELSTYDVKVPSKNTKIVRIKFSKDYNPKRQANKIRFLNVILDEEKYKENEEDKSSKISMEVKF